MPEVIDQVKVAASGPGMAICDGGGYQSGQWTTMRPVELQDDSMRQSLVLGVILEATSAK